MLAMGDSNKNFNIKTVYWFPVFILNQLAANYAQVLMENSWEKTNYRKVYNVLHGNFLTNLFGLPFFMLSLPFYFSQDNIIPWDYIWIPVVVALFAIVFTIGANVLMQIEDMTYSMMAGIVTNILVLILIYTIPYPDKSHDLTIVEIVAYIFITVISIIYMTDSSDHSGLGFDFINADTNFKSLILLILISTATFLIANYSKYFAN